MNIDKNLLMQLAALDDRSLAAAVKTFAASSGMKIEGEIDKARLDALRSAFCSATDADLENAKHIFEEYKKK